MEAFILSLIPIVLYILCSLSLYTISRRRGLPHAWVSWVPLVNIFQLGTVADHYQLSRKGRKGFMRWVLILSGAACIAGLLLILAAALKVIISLLPFALTFGLLFLSEDYASSVDEVSKWASAVATNGLLLCIPLLLIHPFVRYRVYRSCAPSTAVLYLLLSLLLPFLHPLFLFLLRKKDDAAVYGSVPSDTTS